MNYKLLIIGLLAIYSCSSKQKPYVTLNENCYVQIEERRNDSTEWELVLEDQFDKGELDTTHWSRIGLYSSERFNWSVEEKGRDGWKEIVDSWHSYMSGTNPEAVKFDDDNILLRGVLNQDTSGYDNRPYHTGGIWTRNKFAFQYGRIEIRAKLDPAYGAWPAIWMLSANRIYPDQHNGEMDIMERLNHDDFVYQTNHNHWTLTIKQEEPKRFTTAKINPDDYNVYSVSWYPDKLVYAVNGVESITYPKVPGAGTFQWPYDQPFFLIVDQQLEGWPGKVTNPEELPIDMSIDWVRLYQ